MSLKSLTRPIRCYRLFEDPTQRRFHDFIRGPTQNGASISIPKYSADFSCCRYIQGPVKLAEDSWRICFSRLTTVSLPISLYLILPLPHSPSTSFSLYLIPPLPHSPSTLFSLYLIPGLYGLSHPETVLKPKDEIGIKKTRPQLTVSNFPLKTSNPHCRSKISPGTFPNPVLPS